MSASLIKQYLVRFLNQTGYFWLKHRILMRKRAVILMYHRVIPECTKSSVPVQPGMYVTPNTLRLHLTYLKEKFQIISLGELINRLQDGMVISRCCAITFDDGWRDNFMHAFPVFRKLNVPVTIFLTTGFVGTHNWFWPEEIAWCVKYVMATGEIETLPAPLSELLEDVQSRHEEIVTKIDYVIEAVKHWTPAKRNILVEKCTEFRLAHCDSTEEKRLLLSWEEVREMEDSGLVSFGSHTVTHALLDQLTDDELFFELKSSITQLKDKLNNGSRVLAYPNGNFSSNVIKMMSKCGYVAGVTTQRGFVEENSPLYLLPRIAIHEDVSCSESLLNWRLFVR